MDNTEEFINTLRKDLWNIQPFYLACIYKDICFKNYKYNPRCDNCNRIIHEWEHNFNHRIITVDMIRNIMIYDMYDMVTELQTEYLNEAQHYNPSDENHEKYQIQLKKIAEICILISRGVFFKEFIDSYKNGYFN
jgi:hypothetical protein